MLVEAGIFLRYTLYHFKKGSSSLSGLAISGGIVEAYLEYLNNDKIWSIDITHSGDGLYECYLQENTKHLSLQKKKIPLLLEDYQVSEAQKIIEKIKVSDIETFSLFYMVITGALRTAMRGRM